MCVDILGLRRVTSAQVMDVANLAWAWLFFSNRCSTRWIGINQVRRVESSGRLGNSNLDEVDEVARHDAARQGS